MCQQPKLPSTGTKSTPLPRTPGNGFPCSRPSSTLPHPHLLPASLLMTVTYFTQKVKDISFSFIPASIFPSSVFTQFSPLTSDEVNKTITSNQATTCPLDAIPSSLLQDVSSDILPFLTSIINSSLTSGIAPASFKTARIKPLLKKQLLIPPTSRTTDRYLFFHSSLKHWNVPLLTNCPPISHLTTCLTLTRQASRRHTPLRRLSSR